jgi:hypothetical protein
MGSTGDRLLQTKSFLHQPLQAGLVEDVISEFFIRKHGQRGALGSRNQLRGFLDREVRILADDGHDHADHDLQAADLLRFLLNFTPALRIFQGALFARSARLLPSSLMN